MPCYQGGDLGAIWTAKETIFKLWAPTAQAVTLHLYATGTDEEVGARDLGTQPMRRAPQGVWQLILPGDWCGYYYQYELAFADHYATTADPWARACGANGARSMVLDLAAAAPQGWAQDVRPVIPAHARCVWETHVADFSADPHCGVPAAWRGKYLGFTPDDTTLDGEGITPTCLNYLKRLGVTHVQLMPIYDYATVDETKDTDYNWGYDPLNYNVPEGSYATDPYNGAVRVKECRAMVAALHGAGLGVVMDVVYNHTYFSDSWLERTVPGYWNRRWSNGQMTNGSGCGCDLATEREMVRRYIVQSCVYWASAYHLDGFRFDLMALYDVETMNAIRAALDALPGGRDILMYGEPWQGGGTCMAEGARPADKGALQALDARIGFFCDNTRDAIKGGVFDAVSAGYVNGGPYHGVQLLHALGAWQDGEGGFAPRAAGQVVQYVSAHDNYTLWDKLKCVAGRTADFAGWDGELLQQNRMAAGIYLTCQGLPFMLSGEEFARTKYGDHNSYRGPLQTNLLDWRRARTFDELTSFYRGLLAIRRAWPELSGAQGQAAPTLLAMPGWIVGFVLERPGPGDLIVFYNPERTRQWVTLPGGTWRMLCDGTHAAAVPFGPARNGALDLPPVSVSILVSVAE